MSGSLFDPRNAKHRAAVRRAIERHRECLFGERLPTYLTRTLRMIDLLDELLGTKGKGKR